MQYGLKTLNDLEVVELLLGLRLDQNSYRSHAEKLFKNHSTLSDVMDASLNGMGNLSLFKEEPYHFGLRLPYEVANRYLFQKAQENPIINSSDAVLDYLKHSMRSLRVEHFKVLYLNGRNMLIKDEDVSKGTLTTAAVYPREVIKSALKYDAAALVFAHNHISGNPRPSQNDIDITNKLCDAADLFDIRVHDHIIVTQDNYFNFSDSDYMDALQERGS